MSCLPYSLLYPQRISVRCLITLEMLKVTSVECITGAPPSPVIYFSVNWIHFLFNSQENPEEEEREKKPKDFHVNILNSYFKRGGWLQVKYQSLSLEEIGIEEELNI